MLRFYCYLFIVGEREREKIKCMNLRTFTYIICNVIINYRVIIVTRAKEN